MKAKLLLSILLYLSITGLKAQTIDDFGRIALRADVSNTKNLSDEAKNMLTTLLQQIATDNGIAATDVNPRFVITAKIDVLNKDIVPGPPKMFSQNLKITLFVGDVIESRIFSNTSVSVIGVGVSETKAYINALKKVNTNTKTIKTFIDEGKNKILAYYQANCDKIMSEAKTFAAQGKYSEAIYNLALVPDVCTDCYKTVLDLQSKLFTQKIESEGKQDFQQAQTLWAQQPDKANADNVMRLIRQINPDVTFIGKVQSFVKEVSTTVEIQQLREWEQSVKEYNDRVEAAKQQADRNYRMEQMRTRAYRDIAVEYAKNQPKTVVYNRLIVW